MNQNAEERESSFGWGMWRERPLTGVVIQKGGVALFFSLSCVMPTSWTSTSTLVRIRTQ